MDQGKKKELLNQYKEEQKNIFLKSLPMPVENFIQLFDYLDEADEECGGDFSLTVQFLKEQHCAVETVLEWLCENGAGCDCEVLDNIEEQFEEMRII